LQGAKQPLRKLGVLTVIADVLAGRSLAAYCLRHLNGADAVASSLAAQRAKARESSVTTYTQRFRFEGVLLSGGGELLV